MPKAGDLKRGMIVEINGEPHVVKNVDVKSPSSRGANTLYKVRFNNVQSKQKLEQTFKGEDMLKDMDFSRREVQYLYQEGDMYTFMDVEDYSQYTLNADDLDDQLGYLVDGLEGLSALLVDGDVIGIELPQSVNLVVVETAPAMKGATATGRTKPATLTSGIEVQVPEYITVDDVLKINTGTGRFMSRV
ncbi:MAG TPA: elongation factor P-like protein YeiP [Gammaproteobacteria bacterium]|nr:elongation factor P-like protein YeiP [Gammaproteobacteria bacterium]